MAIEQVTRAGAAPSAPVLALVPQRTPADRSGDRARAVASGIRKAVYLGFATSPAPEAAPERAAVRQYGDPVAIRVASRIRVLIATGIAGAASFLDPQSTGMQALALLIGLVYLPWATAVLFSSDQRQSRLATVGGSLGDMVLIALAQLLVPSLSLGLMLAMSVVVAFAFYTWPEPRAWLLEGVALAMTGGAAGLSVSPDRATLGQVAGFGVLLATLLLLVDRITRRARGAEDQSALLGRRADVMLAAVADSVVVTDASGRIVASNASAERVLGSAEAGLVGHPCDMALRLRDGERRLSCASGCALLAARLTGEDCSPGDDVEVWRELPDGNRQPLLARATAIETRGGAREVVHSFRDISRLKQADEAKTLFLATASHELKTPLTVITGFAATLLGSRTPDPEKQRVALEAIHRRAFELNRVVDRLLLSSRIEAGRIEIAGSVVDVRPIVAESAAALSAATGREIAVREDGDSASTFADAQAVRTVVEHLLENAVKYSPDGGLIEIATALEGGTHVTMTVTDHGIGMDAETISRCFEKFWQGDTSGTRRFGGSGIGLYIVKSLVDAMDGSIEVESMQGIGSRFRVRLPLLRAEAPAPPVEASPLRPAEKAIASSSIVEFMRQIGVPQRGQA